MTNDQLNELVGFLLIAIPALIKIFIMAPKNTPAKTRTRIEAQEVEKSNGNGDGNGNTYASQRQTIDMLGKRQDDTLDELRDFKREIRDEIREGFRESKQDTKKRHDDFVELARRRDDGWIMQFNDFGRAYRADSERRDTERKEMQTQISELRNQFSNQQAAFAELMHQFEEIKELIKGRAA